MPLSRCSVSLIPTVRTTLLQEELIPTEPLIFGRTVIRLENNISSQPAYRILDHTDYILRTYLKRNYGEEDNWSQETVVRGVRTCALVSNSWCQTPPSTPHAAYAEEANYRHHDDRGSSMKCFDEYPDLHRIWYILFYTKDVDTRPFNHRSGSWVVRRTLRSNST